MTREWGDNAGRPKHGLDDRRAPPRSSPEGLRREADLRRELDSRAPRRSPPREARLSPSRDRRRSPARDGRRSPPRDDRRDRPRLPVVEARQPDRRRSPSPERRRARSPSPSRHPVPAAADAPSRRYQPPPPQPAQFPSHLWRQWGARAPGRKEEEEAGSGSPPCYTGPLPRDLGVG
nr:probable splicing factor, arginine/serine-rich 5 [Aegilops tauschii subsp. strangulata]